MTPHPIMINIGLIFVFLIQIKAAMNSKIPRICKAEGSVLKIPLE